MGFVHRKHDHLIRRSTEIPIICLDRLKIRAQEIFDYLLAMILSITFFVRAIGGSVGDLDRIWFPVSDLIGWYHRSLALTTSGSPTATDAFNFPLDYQTNWGWMSFDLIQVTIQWLGAKSGIDPISSTNLMIVLMVGLTSGSALFTFKRLGIGRLLSIAGAFILSTLPFTLFRTYHPNISFAWPYVLCCVAILGLNETVRLKTKSYFIIGILIGSSGSYSILFCVICISLVSLVSFMSYSFSRRAFVRQLLVLLAGLVVALASYLALLRIWKPSNTNLDIFNFRDPSEARFWQGWPISNFLPGPISGLPILSPLFRSINDWFFPSIDSSSLCPSDWRIEGPIERWGCLRVIEAHSLNSIATLIGNWLILAVLLVFIVAASNQGMTTSRATKFLGVLARDRSVPTLTIIWVTVVFTYSYGFGLLIARVLPGARSWGRMSLFSSVCAVLVLFILLNRLVHQRQANKPQMRIVILMSFLLLFDQANYKVYSLSLTRPIQNQYSDFASDIREQYPRGCGIAQFPSQRYTTGISRFNERYTVTSEYFLSLYLPELRWSAGPTVESSSNPWPPKTSPFETEYDRKLYFEQFVLTALQLDVCGFVIDRTDGSGVTDWDETFFRNKLNALKIKYEVIRRTNLTSLQIVQSEPS